MNARIQIVPQSSFTTTVSPWGFDMLVEYDYDPGESASFDVEGCPGPGTPANATLYACRVGGVNITEMLSDEQRECIEEKIIEGARS